MNFLRKFCPILFDSPTKRDTSKYKSLSQIEKKDVVDLIDVIKIPKNDKKNIIIMDDNDIAGDITKTDIESIGSMAKFIANHGDIETINKRYKLLLENIDDETLTNLSKLNLDDFNIILVTGKMAGYTLISALDRGLTVDYAILDIILGGSGVYRGKTTIVDGIDVAKEIISRNQKAHVMFYTGCSFEKGQVEWRRVSLLTDNIEDMVLHKNHDLLYKKEKIINLLSREEG